jgi:hypothetical protein
MLESQQGMSWSGNIYFLWILPKFFHSGQLQLQMIQPAKRSTRAALLAQSAPLSCAHDPTAPCRTFWLGMFKQTSQKELDRKCGVLETQYTDA